MASGFAYGGGGGGLFLWFFGHFIVLGLVFSSMGVEILDVGAGDGMFEVVVPARNVWCFTSLQAR